MEASVVLGPPVANDGDRLSRARDLADTGRDREAIGILGEIARRPGPHRAREALLVLGCLLLAGGKRAQARRAYLLSRGIGNDDGSAAFVLWRRYTLAMALGDYRQALADGRAILADGRWEVIDGLLDPYALSYRHRGSRRSAGRAARSWFEGHLRALDRLGRARPGDPWVLAYRANLLRMRGRRKESEREFARLESAAAGRDRFLLWMAGCAYLRWGRAEDAARVFLRIVDAFPETWRLRCWLGEALLCAGRREEALRQFARAADMARGFGRSSAKAWQAEGRLWIGDYSGALRALRHAAGCPTAPGWRGASLLKSGYPERALKVLDEACRRSPFDGEAVVWRSEALLRLGRPQEAVSEARRAFAIAPNPWALVIIALARERLGDAAAGPAAIRRLRTDFPKWWAAWSSNGDGSDKGRLESMLERALGNRRPEPYTAMATLQKR